LEQVTPLTHAVLNATKRVIVIAIAVCWFANIPDSYNLVGVAVTVVGSFWYSYARLRINQKGVT